MPKQRILIVTELYPYPGNIYLGTFITQQLDVLKEYYDITVLTVYPEFLKFKNNQPPFSRQEKGLTVISLSHNPLWILGLGVLRIPVSLRTYINKQLTRRRLHRVAQKLHADQPFDLVHGHETYFGDEAGPIGKKLGIPSVFTLHSFYYYHEKIFGKYVTRLALNNLLLCNHYICVSTIAAETYIKKGLERNKFSIIPNGITPEHIIRPNQKIVDFAKGRKVLLSVGYISEDKRFDISIRVLAQLRDQETVLVIVGIGMYKKKLQNLADSLHCGERIFWLGAVEPNLMFKVYQAADFLIHPSMIDSFSMVCLEAMAQGKVTICTTLIGICEFTRNEENIIMVPPNDVTAIVSAIKRLFSNPAEHKRIAANAYTFGTTMSWKHQVSSIVKIYNQLIT